MKQFQPLIRFLGNGLRGFPTNNSIRDEITLNRATWLPYILGVVDFMPEEVYFATQRKLDIITYIGVERENIRRGNESDFV